MNDRMITYCEAINEASKQEMSRDPNVFVYGIGVPDHKRIFGTTLDLDEFGPDRFIDTPLCEDSLMGFGIGAALNGLKPIFIHIRVDFLLLALNQLINMAPNISYCSGGKLSVPIVIRAIIGRGWGQGCQHSKTLHSIFAHIPGLKVVMPSNPYNAKGLLVSAIRDLNPVIFIEHRWLYWQYGNVPLESYEVKIGSCCIVREGKDITIVATSWLLAESLHAAKILSKHDVEVEIIDTYSISPLDDTEIIQSVNKTGRCLVVDNDWVHCGFSAEISARISNKCFHSLSHPVERMGFAECPCPTARHLEEEFYPDAKDIVKKIESMLDIEPIDMSNEILFSHENKFRGPF